MVLSTLREAGLTLSPRKCKWGGRIVEFLGHCVGEGKRSIPERRVEAIKSYRKPRTKKQLRVFLGVVSFYRSYVEMLAEETAVLTPATSRAAPNTMAWTSEMDQAFSNICGSVSMSCELVYRCIWERVGCSSAGTERRTVKGGRFLLASNERTGEEILRERARGSSSSGSHQTFQPVLVWERIHGVHGPSTLMRPDDFGPPEWQTQEAEYEAAALDGNVCLLPGESEYPCRLPVKIRLQGE